MNINQNKIILVQNGENLKHKKIAVNLRGLILESFRKYVE